MSFSLVPATWSVAVGHLLAASSTAGQNMPGGIVGRLLHFHGPAAYALVGFLAFAEAALFVGFFIPGETAVVIGGVLAGLHQVNLELMIVVVVVSAIAGDSVGFEVGKKAGPWLLGHRPFRGNLGVRKTMQLLERYGGPAVFLGRFIAFARAVIPGLAGSSGLGYRTFLIYNATGGIVWGVGYTMLGFVVGLSFERILREVGVWSLAIVGGVVLIVIAAQVLLKRREKRKLAAEFGAPADAGVPDVAGASVVPNVAGRSGGGPGAVGHGPHGDELQGDDSSGGPSHGAGTGRAAGAGDMGAQPQPQPKAQPQLNATDGTGRRHHL